MSSCSRPAWNSPVLLIILLFGLLSGITGCAANRVKAGDTIRLNYTCRLAGGEIATTTDPDIAGDPQEAKASFFYPSNKSGAVRMFPGPTADQSDPRDLKAFESEVRRQLAAGVVGLPYDLTSPVVITSAVSEQLEEENRYLNFDRIITKPVLQKLSRANYIRGQKVEPVVGGKLSKNGLDYAEVVSLDEKEVTIKVLADPPLEVDTPWGKAIAKRNGDRIETVIDARVGAIVRTGSALGRITEVNASSFVVDYGHPFAYETLNCDVIPERFEGGEENE